MKTRSLSRFKDFFLHKFKTYPEALLYGCHTPKPPLPKGRWQSKTDGGIHMRHYQYTDILRHNFC